MIKLKTALALAFILAFGFSSFATISVTTPSPIAGCVDTFSTNIVGTNYSWNFGPNSYPETLTGSGLFAAPAAFLTAGSHTVKVTVTTGGGPVVDSIVVNVQASTENITITPSGPTCQGASVTYTASTGFLEYAFFVNDSLKQLSTSNTYTAELLSGDSVRVFGLAGTCFSNASTTLYVNSPLPPHLISSVPSDTICVGQLVTFTAEPAAFDSFFFYVGGSLQQADTSNVWSTSQLYNQNVIHVAVEKNGCTSIYYSNQDTMTVKPTPQITDTATTTGICAGSPITIAADPTGLSSYDFYINSASVQNDTSHTYTSSAFQNNDTVTVTGTLNGCTSALTKPIIISVGTQPTVTLSPQTDTICQGSPATYTASPSTYSEYLFYVNSTLVQDGPSNVFTSTTLTNNSTVEVVASNHGCESGRVGGFPIDVIPGAKPTLTYNSVLCYGLNDTVTVNTGGSGTDTYLWSTGATTSSVVLGAGPFSVTVTNTTSNSCGAIFFDTIVGDPQIFNTNILTLHLCSNPAHGDLQLDGKGGTGTFVYSVVGIDSTNSSGQFLGLLPGGYSFTITDSLGCVDNGSVTIPNSIAGDSFTVSVDSVTCFGFSNGQIIITPDNPQDGPFVYSVDNSQFVFGDTFTGIAPGPHNITVKSFVFGCEYTYTTSVGAPTQYNLSVNPDTIMTSAGKLDTVTASTTFPNPVYTWSPVTGLSCTTCAAPVITADTVNMVYAVKVNTSGDSSCYAVDSVVVIVAPPVLPDSFIMPSAFTPNGDGRNDYFGPITSVNFTNGTIKVFKIYNRWGQLVFNGNQPWDGKFDGKEQPVGTYVYYIEVQYPAQDNSTPTYKKEGSVTLLR